MVVKLSQGMDPEPSDKGADDTTRHALELDLTEANTRTVWRQYLRAMGPGLVTGASDDDPSGIATYSQAGAQFGLSFLWTALLTLPLMAAVQEICDRTALATGTGLGELAVKRFRRTGWGSWLRSSLPCSWPMPSILPPTWLPLAPAWNCCTRDRPGSGPCWPEFSSPPCWYSGLLPRIALVFKLLCVALLTYLVVAIMVTQWGAVLTHTLIPHIQLSKAYLALLVAVLGTTISPYLFFWQSAHRLEEMRDEPEGGVNAVPLKDQSPARAQRKQRTSRLDVFVG